LRRQSILRPSGGARRDRTDDLLLAKQALSQLSYGPAPVDVDWLVGWLAEPQLTRAENARLRPSGYGVAAFFRAARERRLVGLGRFELPTSRLSSARSNQLSYKPGSENSRIRNGRRRTDDASSVVCRPISVFQICLLNSSFVKKEKRRRRCPANGPTGLRPNRS
jgi:hypothetical protein